MPINEPEATSTPTTVPRVTGRASIKDQNSVQSPIDLDYSKPRYETRSYERTTESANRMSPEQSPRRSPRGIGVSKNLPGEEQANRSGSDDLEDSDQYSEGGGVSSDGDNNYEPENQNARRNESGGILMGIIAMAALYFYDPSSESPPLTFDQKFNSLEKEFYTQEEDFWRNIKVNILEIPVLDQPRTIILLYNNKAESTLNKILAKISDIALCKLSKCSNSAVVIEGATLNTSEIVKDHGKIISKYRNNLERNGVMIVKNLEKVPGASAQAFHSFCDDYHPIVKKALILFTIKVENLPAGYPMKFIEHFLLDLWSDISKDDVFYPLFTRISSTILSVKPE